MRPQTGAIRLDPGLEILAERLLNIDTHCVLATVISTTGSTYSKAGARMLIEADGRITGLLSGGCLEQDLREHAAALLTHGIARTVIYDMRADNDLIFGLGAGCEGRLEILVERVRRDDRAGYALTRAADLSRAGRPTALITLYEGPSEQRGTHLWGDPAHVSATGTLGDACVRAIEHTHAQVFRWTDDAGLQAAWLQPVLPLPGILICGAGPDAVPVAAALQTLRFPVTVTDHRPAYAVAGHFPGARVSLGAAATLTARLDLSRFFAAVVMSHHLASDTDYLRNLAASSVSYLGVLGPRTRRDRLLSELGQDAAAIESRLKGPIGFDIGAVTPEGIALSIAAEIHAAAASHGLLSQRHRFTLVGERAAPAAIYEGAAP